VTPDTQVVAASAPTSRVPLLVVAAAPLVLLAVLVGWLYRSGPADALRANYPPVERLTYQRVALTDGVIVATVLNDGPDPVTIAQVAVDDAFWTFTATNGRRLSHLGRTTLTIPYPWVHGETHTVRVITSTGLTFDHTIGVAVPSPGFTVEALGVFALIGLYVGVLPVAIGLLWYPFVSRLGRAGMDFVLALTIGLLLFLLVDASSEGAGIAASLPESLQGAVVLVFVAAGAYLALESFGRWLHARRRDTASGWVLALLVAVGIGLHNFGEGLAIGAAFALGEAALGTLLVVGFTLHNTTEGLAIVAPLARAHRTHEPAPVGALVKLGLVGGAPTIAGAWLGGLTYAPLWSVVFLALGIGAIAQVAVLLLRQIAGERSVLRFVTSGPALGGLACGVVLMYVTGMLIG
jgi:zinc transporter, ZIP family